MAQSYDAIEQEEPPQHHTHTLRTSLFTREVRLIHTKVRVTSYSHYVKSLPHRRISRAPQTDEAALQHAPACATPVHTSLFPPHHAATT